MKKIIIVLGLSVCALMSTFAEVDVLVELSTNIVKFDTGNTEEAEFFTATDYDDFKIEFNLDKEKFGAKAVIVSDATMEEIGFNNISAWGYFGDAAKIQFGDFDNRAGMSLTGLIDEYELGILQYNLQDSTDDGKRIFKTLAEGNRLDNFVVDFYLDSFSPIPATVQLMGSKTILSKSIQVGGRVHADIFDVGKINVTAVYREFAENAHTTIGTFLELPNLLADLKVVAGGTVRLWDRKLTNTQEVDYGIDLRAQMPIELPFGNLVLATQNNYSVYNDADNEQQYVALSNELKARMPIVSGMAAIVSLKSHYFSNPSGKITESTPETFYDLNTFSGITYNFGKDVTLETGVEVLGIGNNQEDITIAVPFTFKYWF